MSFQQEYDATIAASEDLNLPRHSGASSSSQHTAASRVPTLLKLGSFETGFTKVSADYGSGASRTGIKKTCADMDRETVVSSLSGSVSREKRDGDQNVVRTLRDKQNLLQKAELAVRGENSAQQKLSEAGAEIVKREFVILLFMRLIKNSNPNDYSYNWRINGLLRLKERRLVCVKNRNEE